MNTIVVAGNVGRDPEIKYAPSGLAILKFSVADTSGKDEKKKTTWHDIVVFGEQAENVVNQIGKGRRVVIVGKLQIETYDKKDGTKGKRVEVIADEVAVSLRWSSESAAIKNVAAQFDAQVEEELF
jgi:single-strand DNA-binding protein